MSESDKIIESSENVDQASVPVSDGGFAKILLAVDAGHFDFYDLNGCYDDSGKELYGDLSDQGNYEKFVNSDVGKDQLDFIKWRVLDFGIEGELTEAQKKKLLSDAQLKLENGTIVSTVIDGVAYISEEEGGFEDKTAETSVDYSFTNETDGDYEENREGNIDTFLNLSMEAKEAFIEDVLRSAAEMQFGNQIVDMVAYNMELVDEDELVSFIEEVFPGYDVDDVKENPREFIRMKIEAVNSRNLSSLEVEDENGNLYDQETITSMMEGNVVYNFVSEEEVNKEAEIRGEEAKYDMNALLGLNDYGISEKGVLESFKDFVVDVVDSDEESFEGGTETVTVFNAAAPDTAGISGTVSECCGEEGLPKEQANKDIDASTTLSR